MKKGFTEHACSLCYQRYDHLAHLADHKKGETTQLNHSNMFIKNNKIQRKRRIGVTRQLTSCSAIWTVALRECANY